MSPLQERSESPPTMRGDILINGHLIVHSDLRKQLPDWVPAEMPCVLPSLPTTCDPDERLVLGFRPLGEKEARPLVRLNPDGSYTTVTDLSTVAEYIRSEGYRTPYRPLYTRIPLPSHRVPRRLRALMYRLLSSSARQTSSTAFTPLEGPRLAAGRGSEFSWRSSGSGSPCEPLTGFTFPAWPKDMSADTLALLGSLLNIDKPPLDTKSQFRIDPVWPDGKKYAVVLTHDVDSGWAFEHTENVAPLVKIESSAGVRSAWYFVVNSIPAHELLTRGLQRDAHEIGFHCYNHDHRFPFLSESRIRRRLEQCRPFLERFHVKGLRSANYLKTPRFLSIMGERFAYDLSFRDSYHGAGGAHGCSTVFPFRIAGSPLLEIPTTVPEDYDLFARGLSPEDALKVQQESIENIKRRGGVVNIVTHAEPHLSVNEKGMWLYNEIVRSLSTDSSAWITLPRDLAGWWNRAGN